MADSKKEQNRSKSKSGTRELAAPAKSVKKEEKSKKLKAPKNPDSLGNQLILVLIGVAGLLVGACLALTDMSKGTSGLTGPVGYYVSKVFFGLFGIGAFFIPLFTLVYAAMWKHSVRERKTVSKGIFMLLAVMMISSLLHLVYTSVSPEIKGTKFYDIASVWEFSSMRRGGGIIGGLIGGGLGAAIKVIAWPVVIIAIVIFVMLMFELTPNMIAYLIRQSAQHRNERNGIMREKRRSAAELRKAEREEKRAAAALATKENAINNDNGAEKDRAENENSSAEKRRFEDVPVGAVDGENVNRGAQEAHRRDVSDLSIDDVFRDNVKQENAGVNGGIKSDVEGNDCIDFEKSEKDITIKIEADGQNETPVTEEIAPEATKDRLREQRPKVKVKREKAAPGRLPEEKPAGEYRLPPIDLLTEPDLSMPAGSDRASLEKNGCRLVETLRSFKVDVDIINISQGPTITRYELVPKAGVRVRSIANLVDDIALSLETQGIRIEAPIPGKAAVGIEVPNKNLSTVWLRELIESPQFQTAKSKLTCCLGKSVSGEPIYLDIVKMPHLLIAGATGMGKSVCINSLLMSLLYRATPDEVRLILIDPKKVELNTYNRLPHLLVPVVSQPKTAAGSLAWAVTEMDRRFELIEEAGVRDITGYNKVAETDSEKEKLPQIVIVIDELADLMMTAPVDVETSICRLAQKARAAGMHLILGTQRPSVDVITGLIKANIPSRIAFTVASNRDSMTIIDVAGAEKLIGRGDMLYNPVGAMKPIRVQGAFVSESDVEKVCDFIKEQMTGIYDENIIKEIDKNAKQCGQKKKPEDGEGGDFSDDLDEKFWDAVDIAVSEGKISTSLLQRHLSIGYGRAAKIVDEMTRRGIVSPPDGQKPRTTLITATELAEMKMRLADGGSGGYGRDGGYDEDDEDYDDGEDGDDESDVGADDGDRPFTEDDFDDDAPF